MSLVTERIMQELLSQLVLSVLCAGIAARNGRSPPKVYERWNWMNFLNTFAQTAARGIQIRLFILCR